MDRGAKYRHGLAKEKRLVQLTRELGWTAEDVRTAEELLGECESVADEWTGRRADQ